MFKTTLIRAKDLLRTVSIVASERLSMLLLYAIGACLEIAGTITSIYATAQIASLLATFASSGDAGNIWTWVWIDVGAAAAIGLGFAAMNYAERLGYFVVAKWATLSFQSSLYTIDLGDFYDKKMRNQINKVAGGYTWQIAHLYAVAVSLIYSIVRFIAITIVVSQITWWIVPLIILFLLPSLLIEGKLAKLLWFVWDSKGDERHVFWGLDWIIRQPKGQMELRNTQASGFVTNKLDKLLSRFYREQESKVAKTQRPLILTKLLESAGTAIGLIVLLSQVLARSISLDRYFFLSGALLRIGGALNAVFGTLARAQEGLLFARSYFDLLDRQPTITDKTNAFKLPADAPVEIEFSDVSFTYPDQDTPVFEDLNLHIKPGEHVALVGENGAGKSTLIKLLIRFYLPTKGQILINGHDLNNIQLDSWYEHVATLFQDFNQYPLSLKEKTSPSEKAQSGQPKQLLSRQLGLAG